MNRRALTNVLLIILIALAIALAYHYHNKQETTLRSLQLKLKLLEEGQKESVPWKELLAATRQEREALPEPEDVVQPTETKPTITPVADAIPIDRQATAQLAKKVESAIEKREELSLEDLDRAIEMAQELILREPDSYSVYKAKLILLLTAEAAYRQTIDDDEVNDLLDEMAAFDMTSNASVRQEAFLVARTDQRIDRLEEDIDYLDMDLTEVDLDLDYAEAGSDEEADLLAEARAIERDIDDKEAEIARLEADLESELARNENMANEDILEIPLQRALAKGDYPFVINEAEALLDEFGDSVTAYYYLIRALELEGQADLALDTIATSNLSGSQSRDLEERLRSSRSQDPEDYWKRLRF